MMSRTVSAMRGEAMRQRGGQRADHVGGDHAVGPVRRGGDLARAQVRVDAGAGGVGGREALGQHRADHAGEHVAGARRGERRAPAARDRDAAVGRGHQRVVALEHDDRLRPARRPRARSAGGARSISVGVDARAAARARRRAGSGPSASAAAAAPPSTPPASALSPSASITSGTSMRSHQLARELLRALVLAEARAEHDRVGAADRLERRLRPRSASARRRRSGSPTIIASSSLTVNESSRLRARRPSRSPRRRASRPARPSTARRSARASRR